MDFLSVASGVPKFTNSRPVLACAGQFGWSPGIGFTLIVELPLEKSNSVQKQTSNLSASDIGGQTARSSLLSD
jgi:hypothetical protein